MIDYGKVSVIMGIYNCAKTLPEAIESIVNQTYTNWELIMCDDASDDNTFDVAKSYLKQYPEKIVLLKNDVNSKLSFTLNHCLKFATGKFVARMDGDDISTIDRFEKEIDYLINHPEYDLVGCSMQRFNDEGKANIDYAIDNPNYFTLKNKIPFNHATILTYKYVYDKLSGYTVSERTNRAQDYDLWFRFYAAGFNGNNLQDALYFVREDSNAIRRRTFKVRWNAFKTTRIGFKMLDYPKTWIIISFFRTLFKSLVPYKLFELYRKIQNKPN